PTSSIFHNYAARPQFHPLSLHGALPIYRPRPIVPRARRAGEANLVDSRRAPRPRRDHDELVAERLWPPEERAGCGRLGRRLFLLLLLDLERELAGREDAPDLEVEVIRVGGRLASGLVRHHAVPIELEQALVERLHPVLRGALGDDGRDLGRSLRLADAVANERGADHDLDRRYAAFAGQLRHQALRDDALDDRGELIADLLLLKRRERAEDAVDGFRGVQGVEGREHEVAGFRRVERHRHGLRVAHLADQDDVGVLAERGPQRASEVRRIVADLTLAHDAVDVLV